MPASRPLWALTFDDLGLGVRAHNGLGYYDTLRKAWHAAVLCDACLLRNRTIGRVTLRKVRQALAAHGFPPPPPPCGDQWYDQARHRKRSGCRDRLACCRAMLERGEWEETA